jgi:hypothetical protein
LPHCLGLLCACAPLQILGGLSLFALLRLRALAQAKRISGAVDKAAASAAARSQAREVRIAVGRDSYRRQRSSRNSLAVSPDKLSRPKPSPLTAVAEEERTRQDRAAQLLQRSYRGRVAQLRTELIDRPISKPRKPTFSLVLPTLTNLNI